MLLVISIITLSYYTDNEDSVFEICICYNKGKEIFVEIGFNFF